MTQYPNRQASNRFAWLTPVRRQSYGTGRWMLCETDSHALGQTGPDSASLSVNALLLLMASAFERQERLSNNTDAYQSTISSRCGRFKARLIIQGKDDSRLFIQQRSDYFARMELYVDERLLIAYQEPVWPHLQTPHPLNNERVNIPHGGIELLERTGVDALCANSANEDGIQDDYPDGMELNNDTTAAA